MGLSLGSPLQETTEQLVVPAPWPMFTWLLSGLLSFFAISSLALLYVTNLLLSKFLNSNQSDFYLRRVWFTTAVFFVGVPTVIIVKNGIIKKRLGQALKESYVWEKLTALVRKMKMANPSVVPAETRDIEK